MRILSVPGLPAGVHFDMATPTVEPSEQERLEHHHKRIEGAMAALKGARACLSHSPNAENERLVELAEKRVNALLDDPLQPREAR